MTHTPLLAPPSTLHNSISTPCCVSTLHYDMVTDVAVTLAAVCLLWLSSLVYQNVLTLRLHPLTSAPYKCRYHQNYHILYVDRYVLYLYLICARCRIRLGFDGGQSCHLGVISDCPRCVLIVLDTTTSWPGKAAHSQSGAGGG